MSDAPFEVLDFKIEACDDQMGSLPIEPAQKVRFMIKEAKVQKKSAKDGSWTMTQLSPSFVIGPLGTDGNGKNAGKYLFGWKNVKFPGLLLAYNKEKYSGDWWDKQARYPLKEFMKAVGLDPKNPPAPDAFISALKGKELQADITLEEITEKDENGKYVGTGVKENYLRNFKVVE